MKKNYFTILVAILTTTLNAQLTQLNHAPLASYTFETYQCDVVNPGSAGPNSNWNFSTINTQSNTLLSYLTATVNSPTYPSATIAIGSSTSNTSYYNSSPTELNYYGGNISIAGGGTPLIGTLNYISPAKFASYPMSLNSSISSITNGTINVISPIQTAGTFSGNCNVLVDGSGTLTLPGVAVVFTNVLRVLTSQTINIVTPFASATVIQINYDYYASNSRAPLFSIASSTSILGGSPSTQTIVTRNKNASPSLPPPNSISENNSSIFNLSVFPNPTSSLINFITNSNEATQVLIYDICGKFIANHVLVDNELKLNVSDYTSGFYLYKILNSKNQELKTGKISVFH